MSKIAIAGAGAFGTGLAIALGRSGQDVTLWARDADHAAQMQESRENTARLPGVSLPQSVTVTAKIDDLFGCDAVLICVPMQALKGFLGAHAGFDGLPLVACCKGVSLETGTGPTEIITQTCPKSTAAVLTGPSFAADIARGLPTALTLACTDRDMGAQLQHMLSTPVLRLYTSTDPIGAELGGALKNVIAIAAGMVVGAGLGDSARAALMTRGFAEMTRFAQSLGASPDTLAGLAGFGDLVLTCTSTQSRNFRYGHALGHGEGFDAAITVEGASTARAVSQIAKTRGIDLPITAMVAAVINGDMNIKDATQALLSRPLKEE